MLVQGTHGQDELSKDNEGLSLGQAVALLDEGLEGAALTILINQVDVIVRLDHLHELHHV